MSKRGDARGGDGSTGSTAPTMPGVPATKTPTPVSVDSHAKTAVATQSEKFRALTPHPDGDETSSGTLDTLVGTILEQRYEILRKIGQGGMGAVYEATHKLIGKRVAVKILLDKYAQKDQIVARLEQEARLASSIGHANIIDITDIGQTKDGRMFVVMEFLEGESLGALISRTGRLEQQRALRIARQIASALGAAHQKGIVHRDVKPENVFLLKRGNDPDYVKVVDFGISKSLRPEDGTDSPRLTQTGMVLGTPLYMSPEQARGDDELDHRIDVYALGVILYEMVTGEVPYRGSNYLNILSQVLADDPIPPSQVNKEIGPDLEAVIEKALEKDRDHRYKSMEEMAADLDALLNDSMASTGARITASRRRRKAHPTRTPLRYVLYFAGVSVIVAAVLVAVKVVMVEEGAKPVAAVAGGAAADSGPITVRSDAAPSLAPAPVLARIHIESRPPGVEVFEGGRSLGPTPTVWEGVKKDTPVVLVGEKEGYDYRDMTVNPFVHDGKTVTLVLKRAKSGRGKKFKRPPVEGGKGPDNTAGGDLIPPSN
jgi:tRNA A-37 threonylcarbamoyl transferase component Bud32